MIGSWGDITFEVSYGGESLTFKELTREAGARVVRHDVLDRRQRQQVTGLDLNTVTIPVILDRNLGSPGMRIAQFRAELGKWYPLIIGDEVFGDYTLEKISEKRTRTSNKGKVITGQLDLTFVEYR